jgi:DNA-directed RNA polymerase specialized sigma24 family protein
VTDEQWKRLRKMNARERIALAQEALRRLRADHRVEAEALVLRVYRERGVDETAAVMGMAKGTVSKWCARAKELLEQEISNILTELKDKGF